MMSHSDDKQANIIGTFNTLDTILNKNNVYFDNMVSQLYPSELQLIKANTSDTEAAFSDFRVRLFIGALWSPARKGLASWHSFVMFNCEFVTFPLVSCVRCGA